ncbi:MAG: hypothetical protein ABIY47_17125 [Opitutaceae bacterium]
MAWRIDEHLVRGEIDNRTRGRVTGRLWFAGRPEPIVLDLTGNAWRDLAGRRLEFVNPEPRPGLAESFAGLQRGTTGDITASRKVKVPEIPLDQIGEYYAAKKPWPWHWGNSLYLEWYSTTNGRVVIESASYQLTVSPDSTWDMTPAGEEAQRTENAAALGTFMERLEDALPSASADAPARPQTEAEAEKIQAHSDRLIDRVMARMEREGAAADYGKILSEEIERARRERGEPALSPEEEAEHARWTEEMNASATEALEAAKADSWKRDPGAAGEKSFDPLKRKHPLAARSYELSLRVMRDTEKRGWLTDGTNREHPVTVLIAGITSAGAKLAGALGGDRWPPPLDFCASAIVRLKKAAGYLEDATLAADSCRDEKLTDATWLTEIATEIAALTAGTEALIAELRARLEN